MIAISFHFLAGRYHATPWGRHVNEGAIEWPPSPWRLLRAIVATWKRTLPDLPEGDVKPVLVTLAEPPVFNLPPASTGHSRHYMPMAKSKTLVFDTFVALDHTSQVTAVWPNAKLDDGCRTVLSRILANLNFLGRAESWCEAQLLEDRDAGKRMRFANCGILNGTAHRNEEIVRVLCADPNSAFADEHVVDIESVMQGRGKSKTTIENRHAVYDPNWNLCMETLRLHDRKLSDPPGSRWQRYVRPADSFEIKGNRPTHVRASRPKPQIARFALDSTVLPLVTETLHVAESARRMLMGINGRQTERIRGMRGRSEIFSGKDANGQPLTGHRHAYYVSTDEDGDGRLDHLTIIAEDGFGDDELRALDLLRELKSAERTASGHRLRVLLLGTGGIDDYLPAPIRPSRTWRSVTPFIATRHFKKNGTRRDPPELRHDPVEFLRLLLAEELARLIARRPDLAGMDAAEVKAEPLTDDRGVFRIPRNPQDRQGLFPLQFKRFRRKLDDDGGRRLSGAFRLEFPRAVRGPICLGHSSHFGMGLFFPTDHST